MRHPFSEVYREEELLPCNTHQCHWSALLVYFCSPLFFLVCLGVYQCMNTSYSSPNPDTTSLLLPRVLCTRFPYSTNWPPHVVPFNFGQRMVKMAMINTYHPSSPNCFRQAFHSSLGFEFPIKGASIVLSTTRKSTFLYRGTPIWRWAGTWHSNPNPSAFWATHLTNISAAPWRRYLGSVTILLMASNEFSSALSFLSCWRLAEESSAYHWFQGKSTKKSS